MYYKAVTPGKKLEALCGANHPAKHLVGAVDHFLMLYFVAVLAVFEEGPLRGERK